MPRAATTTDVFNAIAESKRREIVALLANRGASNVNDLVHALDLPQPAVSKHLGVLRRVGLVSVTQSGRQRVYELEAKRLKPVHDWVKAFEPYWSHQLHRIKARAERNESSGPKSAQNSGRQEKST